MQYHHSSLLATIVMYQVILIHDQYLSKLNKIMMMIDEYKLSRCILLDSVKFIHKNEEVTCSYTQIYLGLGPGPGIICKNRNKQPQLAQPWVWKTNANATWHQGKARSIYKESHNEKTHPVVCVFSLLGSTRSITGNCPRHIYLLK